MAFPPAQAGGKLGQGYFALPVCLRLAAGAFSEAAHIGRRQQAEAGEDAIAEKGDPFGTSVDAAFALVQQQAVACEELLDLVFHFPKFFFGVPEDDEIVHIADISAPTEGFFHEMVEAVEVVVAPELAREVSDGQALAPGGGREQVIAGEPSEVWLLGVGIVEDEVAEREGALAPDLAAQFALQDFVVNGGEKFFDVALEHERVSPAVLWVALGGGVGAFAAAARDSTAARS